MTEQNNFESLLRKMADDMQKESDTKVTKAIQLWIKCDDTYRWLVLRLSGFDFNKLNPEIMAKQLRDHFDTMDLLDELDSCIEDMEFEIEGYAK